MGYIWKKWTRRIGESIVLLLLVCGISKELVLGQELTSGAKTVAARQQDVIGDCSEDIRKGIFQSGGIITEHYEPKQTASRTTPDTKALENDLLEAMRAHASKLNLEKYRISKEDFIVLYTRMVNSHPELFYIDLGASTWRYFEWTGQMMEVSWKYYWDKAECKVKEQEYETAIQLAIRDVDPCWSDLEKALYINDYLCENFTYDDSLSYYDAYHGFVEGTTVCQGYALAYQALADRIGLQTQLVTSDSLKHAWNMVKVDGKYYHVDSTWNDNIYEGGASSHYYFLKSTKFFETNYYGTGTSHQAGDYVVQGDWDSDLAKDTDYDQCIIWDNVHSTFNYVNGYWYTFDEQQGDIVEYDYEDGTFVEHRRKNLSFRGLSIGETRCFSSLGDYEGALYFCYENIGIFRWKPEENQVVLVYEFPAEVKKINGSAVYLNVDVYGRVSYLYFDGAKLREINNAFCIDDKEYQISYQLNGGTLDTSAPGSYQTITDTIMLKNPKRAGYFFTGWYSEKELKTKVNCIPKGSVGNKKLYAGWTKTYKITYKLNGGKNSSSNPKSYHKLTGTIVLKNPKKSGYQFKGWYTDKACTKKVTKIKKGSTGNLTLYAKWSKSK